MRKHTPAENALFANCAIDRIVPEQDGGLDVTIESFFEWVVDRTPFRGAEPEISGVTWVDDLTPFIERKLFTVNTAHAAAAYHGHDRGWVSIREALATPELQAEVRAVLDETKTLLVAKHGFSADEQQAYIEKTLKRISNPDLPDTCERVGRGPLRKLSRHERFVGPAAELVERGHDRVGPAQRHGRRAALRRPRGRRERRAAGAARERRLRRARSPRPSPGSSRRTRSSRTWSRSCSCDWTAEVAQVDDDDEAFHWAGDEVGGREGAAPAGKQRRCGCRGRLARGRALRRPRPAIAPASRPCSPASSASPTSP